MTNISYIIPIIEIVLRFSSNRSVKLRTRIYFIVTNEGEIIMTVVTLPTLVYVLQNLLIFNIKRRVHIQYVTQQSPDRTE